jgi:hypothetical protein
MKKGNGRRFGRSLGCCAAVALVASSSIALARGDSSSGKAMIVPQKIGSATATCPKGTGAVASGFASPHFSPRNNRGVARIASRLYKHRLRTSGFNFGQQPGELDSLAYCAKAGLSVRVAVQKVFVAPHSADVAIATCPGASEVISGGFASPGFSANGPQVLTLTSKRVGKNQWRVEGFNMGGINSDGSSQQDFPGTLVAYAYCLNDAPPIITRQKSTMTGQKGKAKAIKVWCPRGMKALSGGFDGNLYLSANPTAAGAIASKRVGRGRAWHLSAISISERSAKISAYAYCMPRHR